MMIHLIRHGHTEANAQKRYCGRTDLPLSQDGVEHLRAFKAQGIYQPATAFYTSGMLRARQTLALLYGDVKADALPEWREYDFGGFEMRRHEELQYDPDYVAWITDTTGDFACPGGESRRQYDQRVLNGFSRLLSELLQVHCESAAAIAHGGTIVHVLSRLFPNEKDFYAWQPRPGLGYTISRNRDGVFTYQAIEGEDIP